MDGDGGFQLAGSPTFDFEGENCRIDCKVLSRDSDDASLQKLLTLALVDIKQQRDQPSLKALM